MRHLALVFLTGIALAATPESITPTAKKPFVPPTTEGRSELQAAVHSYMELPADKVTAHATAAEFPGAVASTERVSRTVKYDSNLLTRWDTSAGNAPNLATGPEVWQDTGLYAAPGETVVVRVPSLPTGRKVQIIIGCHRDSLLRLAKWERFPVITRSWTLKPGENRIANAFGGSLFVKVDAASAVERHAKAAEAADLTFENAVVAPTYVLGQDTAESWAIQRKAPAPWAVLVGKRTILHVPSAYLRELAEPKALLEWWDKLLELQDDLIALDRLSPERVVPDIQISDGFMHSGYPFMCQLKASGRHMIDLARLSKEGDWGFFHELGHNHQRRDWTFPGQTEVTVNLFSLLCMEKLVGKPMGKGHGALRDLDGLMAARLGTPANMGPFEQLAPFVVLIKAHGWEPIRATLRSYKDTPARKAGDTSVPTLQNEFVRRYGQYAKADVSGFFENLGYPVTDETRMALKTYPAFTYAPAPKGK